MTQSAPSIPSAPPGIQLQDLSHAPASPGVPSIAVPINPVPAEPIQDVNHSPAATYQPVTDSAPLPLPIPTDGATRSQFTVEPQPVNARVSLVADIAPVDARYKPTPAAKAPAAKAAAPASGPVQVDEFSAGSEIAGGAVTAPIVSIPEGTRSADVETLYQISDSVRKFAESKGVDISTLVPTGKGGTITKKDVQTAISASGSSTNKAPISPISAVPAPDFNPETPTPAAVFDAEPMVGASAVDEFMFLAEGDDEETSTEEVAASATSEETPAASEVEEPAAVEQIVTGGVGSTYDASAAARGANGPAAPATKLVSVPAGDTYTETTPAAPAPVPPAPVAAPTVAAPAAAASSPAKPAPAPAAAAPSTTTTAPAASGSPETVEMRFPISQNYRRFSSADELLPELNRRFTDMQFFSASFENSTDGLFLIALTHRTPAVSL